MNSKISRRQFVIGGATFITASHLRAATPQCTLMPEQEEGPYYIDSALLRGDIREEKPGVPLNLRIALVEMDSGQAQQHQVKRDKNRVVGLLCSPLPKIAIAINSVWNNFSSAKDERGTAASSAAFDPFRRGAPEITPRERIRVRNRLLQPFVVTSSIWAMTARTVPHKMWTPVHRHT